MLTSPIFVGRERELADLVAGLDDAIAGRATPVPPGGTLAFALEARLRANMGPIDLEGFLEVSDELERVARSVNDGERILMSHVWRTMAQPFHGNMPEGFAERRATPLGGTHKATRKWIPPSGSRSGRWAWRPGSSSRSRGNETTASIPVVSSPEIPYVDPGVEARQEALKRFHSDNASPASDQQAALKRYHLDSKG